MRREILEKIIDLTLYQVREKGWDLLDQMEGEQVQIVANAITREVDDFIEELEIEDSWEDAMDEVNDTDDEMIILDDGPLAHWNDR